MLRLLHRLLPVALLAAVTHSAAFADESKADKPASPRIQQRYELRREHDPNGIGKFYQGREIAHVMGFAGAQWLERSEREEEERISLLVRSLRLKPGQVIADIGAGSGVISIQMAERVLPGGTVMAVDVQQEMLDRLTEWCKQFGVENVQPVRGGERKTNLKPQSIDLAIMVDVYHEFEYPFEMLLDISCALRPGGRIVFVEYRKEDPAVPIKEVHKMSQAQVRLEAEQPEFGLSWMETIHILPRQHVIIFQKTADSTEVPK